MDIKSMVQGVLQNDSKKKRYVVIALVVLLLLIGFLIYLFTRPSATGDTNNQFLADFGLLAPRGGTATSTLKRLPFIELVADHPTVAPGQESTISWVASNATTCVNGSGDALDLTGSVSVSPTAPYTFDVLCTGPNGTQSQSITIEVSTAPIIELVATPSSVLSGKQSYISWDTINADRCEDSEGKTLRLSSGFSVKPTSAYTFSMSCTGPKGTTKKSVTVKITTPFASETDSSGTGKTSGAGTYTDTSKTVSKGTSDTSKFTLTEGSYGENGVYIVSSNANTFTVELFADPEYVPFGGTSNVSWIVLNLGLTGRCTAESPDATEQYLPIGSFNGTDLIKNITTPPITSDQTITLTCTKGAEEISVSKKLTVGSAADAPPVPKPKIISFSVSVDGKPSTQNYASKTDKLVAKWKTNTDAEISSCELKRVKADGTTKSLAKYNQSSKEIVVQFYDSSIGSNHYTLTCTGTSGSVTSAPISGPSSISIIDCSFRYGFGTVSGDITAPDTDHEIVSGTNYGLSGLILCIKSYPKKTYSGGAGADIPFTSFWGFDNTNIGGSKDSAVRASDEQYLCPYTRYYYINNTEVNRFDTEYRAKDNPNAIWTHLQSKYTNRSVADVPTLWFGPSSTFNSTQRIRNGDGNYSYWPTSPITVTGALTCLVSAVPDSDVQANLTTPSNVLSTKKATYSTPNSDLTAPKSSYFVVPDGVTSINVEAWGGGGGAGPNSLTCDFRNGVYTCTNSYYEGVATTGGGGGGSGGYIKKTLAVKPGQVLYITVGAGGEGGPIGKNWNTETTPFSYGAPGGITRVLYPKSDGTYDALIANGGLGGRNIDSGWALPGGSGYLHYGTGGTRWCAGPKTAIGICERITVCLSLGGCDGWGAGLTSYLSCTGDYSSLTSCQAAKKVQDASKGQSLNSQTFCTEYYNKYTGAYRDGYARHFESPPKGYIQTGSYQIGHNNVGSNMYMPESFLSGMRYFAPGGSAPGGKQGNAGGACLYYQNYLSTMVGAPGGDAIVGDYNESAGKGGGYSVNSLDGTDGAPGKVIIRW